MSPTVNIALGYYKILLKLRNMSFENDIAKVCALCNISTVLSSLLLTACLKDNRQISTRSFRCACLCAIQMKNVMGKRANVNTQDLAKKV